MLLLSTGTLHKYGLNRVFHIAKKLRYEGIELVVNDVADTRNVAYLKELQEQYDLPIACVVVPNSSNIEKTKFVINMADELNAGVVVIKSPLWSDFAYTKWVRSNVRKFGAVSSRLICIENPPQGDGLLLPMYALGNVNELATFKNISLDTAHLYSRQLDLMRVYEKFKTKIKYIRLSDTKRGITHLPMGHGVLPLESFLAHLSKNHFKGHISVKLDYKAVGGSDEQKVEKTLAECRSFYEEYFLGV